MPTLREGVVNTITSVHGVRIERASEKGRTNKTPILRGEILRVWRDLAANGQTRKARPNYFTLALLQAALSDLVDDLGDGTIALHGRLPPAPERSTAFSYSEAASLGRRAHAHDARADFELRESDEHWNIKHYIHTHPNEALEQLDGGPWTPSALELSLRVPTNDRVDVIVRDAAGYRVLIEVKPRVGERSIELYAQAAKYRAIWRVLHDLASDQVRCVLAAPSIPKEIARHMYSRHRIESVAVKVPADYVAPPRDR
ncbi:MAG TPA: hypothetical protein VM869_33145 [Enhygromyxa sp.]|nr:hypothetical protein [Enhygromyxa sp.]